MLIIGTFWVLEVMPLAVTSLLPVVLFPLLGVMEVKTISTSYFKVSKQMKNKTNTSLSEQFLNIIRKSYKHTNAITMA